MGTAPLKIKIATVRGVPDFRRRNCLERHGGCGKSTAEVGDISWRGLCIACSMRRAHAAAMDLHHHDGPFFDAWRRGMIACVGGVPLDVAHGSEHTDGHA